MRFRAVAIALLIFSGGRVFVPLAAQSLADVARQEEARRKAIKQPARVLTNKDLGAPPTTIAAPAETVKRPANGSPPTETGKDADQDKKDDEQKSGELPKDQAAWAARAKDLQSQLDRDQTYVEALQSRINALTSDFVNRADPAQRAVIGNGRQKALDELNRLTKQIEADKKAITNLQEDARRAGIPPGWLR